MLKAGLLRECLDLQTHLRNNMDERRLKLLKQIRWLVEIVIEQRAIHFPIKRAWARDLWHLTARLNRKLLAHIACH